MNKIIVTGAFGYSGRFITKKLLENANHVKTLTNSTQKKNPFGKQVQAEPFNFDKPKQLILSMESFDTLINTYWVRFNHTKFNHADAVKNTRILFDCAKEAGIKKIVHTSITNPNKNSGLEYFRGKGELEEYLAKTGLNYSIVRPAVLFGHGDILINNIAWIVRHLPVYGLFGDGNYKLQPIHVDDFADIVISESGSSENNVINAIGLETYSYRELVSTIMSILKINKPIIRVNPYIAYITGKVISFLQNDVTITREEIRGLMDNLLFVDTPSAGKIKLSDYIAKNKDTIGKSYANELQRR